MNAFRAIPDFRAVLAFFDATDMLDAFLVFRALL